jgi:hypothetical protein
VYASEPVWTLCRIANPQSNCPSRTLPNQSPWFRVKSYLDLISKTLCL